MQLQLVTGDITGMICESVDAIVNAANSTLLGGAGVDGAIHRAGGGAILRECRELRRTTYPDGLPAGDAVATTAGRLGCRWVIHTVGPVHDPAIDRSATLRSCYLRSLAVADRVGAGAVAFPLISAGAYGWPKDDAVLQALTAVRAADTAVERVVLVLYDQATFTLAQEVLAAHPVG
ncbi:O-acetyl-ADP-ribose deacetylase [Nakamurella deserti]|uniref:O-acetyl-ADP-ribose deacetylase n=1 Tax=Nakamurella deserti TaxID=2164074 RepID=UPI000DBE2D44|nr:O-acetyl-ADP-ribose deacetylase [Nakamurella deserti]